MSHIVTVAAVRQSLIDVFDELDACFDLPSIQRAFRPASGGWTIDEILEHVGLTNHYLMITWRKAVETALRRAAEGEPVQAGESDLDRLRAIGERGAFPWKHPAHMEPHGPTSPTGVREQLRSQAGECLALLGRIPDGEGASFRLHMSVNGLGRIDLYEWLYFLVQHARRHLQQVAARRAECASSGE